MVTEMENDNQKLKQKDYSQTIYINWVAKEIWMPFDFVTKNGMVEEKALINSRANENMVNIRTAHN